ncbi:hypothetical protein HYDPIDRAFT_118590 [Hydnomerulius pinastri MD-312]|uniref:Uncharacterized protein n=1 Tax=Hydnomerulius pinastri MD-312 TaxID=994086 RepID=A0A0C9VNX4_9AGAM|nr:hypothetical protein HYDPIDRAFT_118590 [Hydnomerulius pinastri MD-312]
MSSGGTQSPPLEATGSHIPMGVSSIDGSCSKPTRDIDQRAEYFSDAIKEHFAKAGDSKDQRPTEKEKQD